MKTTGIADCPENCENLPLTPVSTITSPPETYKNENFENLGSKNSKMKLYFLN